LGRALKFHQYPSTVKPFVLDRMEQLPRAQLKHDRLDKVAWNFSIHGSTSSPRTEKLLSHSGNLFLTITLVSFIRWSNPFIVPIKKPRLFFNNRGFLLKATWL